MTAADTAVLVSAISAAIALFALGWNVYRDVIIRPKVKARLQVDVVIEPGDNPSERETVVSFYATNHGPGHVILQMIVQRTRGFMKKTRWGFLPHDPQNPLSNKLPCKLEVGEKSVFLIPFKKEIFLKGDYGRLGFVDTFGRHHWVPKNDVKRAKAVYKKEFGTP